MGGGVATDSEVGPTPAVAPPAHYRPQLDGLRAVAVYLVVAYHAGIHSFSGGFVGVDVFFVLSGYLVTQLLLRDFRTLGRIDFRRFYSRRFRRLLPAAFVALLVTAAVYTAVAAPADVAGALGGFRAAFLYVANWHFIGQSNDYFAANVNTNPVVHFWSLAVEEQFYVLWPLLLSAAYLVARPAGDRRWKVVRLIVAAGFILSLAAALHLSTVNLNRAYYGTDTRAYELLAGALLAMTPLAFRVARRRTRLVQASAPVSLAGLGLIASSAIHLGPIQRGVAATFATCALILALEVAPAGWAKRVLSSPTVVYLGRVSYGTYLWHWPVIVIVTQRFQPNAISLFALTCLVGTALASLSFAILEQRVRASALLDRYRSAVIAVGLATSLVGGLVLIPAIMHHSSAAVSAATPNGGTSAGDTRVVVPRNLDLEAIRAQGYGVVYCYRESINKCIVARGKGPRVVIIGDSHAESLTPAFRLIARKYSLTVAVLSYPSCPWEQGVVEAPASAPTNLPQVCRAQQDDWYQRAVGQFDPNIVVLLHQALDDTVTPSNIRLPDGSVVVADRPAGEQAMKSAAQHTISELRAPGRKILIVEPLPIAPGGFNPLTCLSQQKYLDACRYVAIARPTRLERYFQQTANGHDTYALNFDRLVCPYLPICDPIVNGVVVKKDPQHITTAFSKHMAGSIGSLLVDDQIIRAP